MGRGSKRLHWKRKTIVEDIRGKPGYGSESAQTPAAAVSVEHDSKKAKRSLQSKVKSILKKGSKETRHSQVSTHPWAKRPVTAADQSNRTGIESFMGDNISTAAVLSHLSDPAKQDQSAAGSSSGGVQYVPMEVRAGPSTATQASGKDDAQLRAREEFERDFFLPGAVPHEKQSNKSAMAGGEGSKQSHSEMHKQRARLMRIKQEAKAMTLEDIAAEEVHSNQSKQVPETKEDIKRRKDEESYLRIYFSQKEKVTDLRRKLKWMESKQDGKESRIEAMENRSLSVEEKIQLRGLKNSSKKLETKIGHANSELQRRKITINQIKRLQEESSKRSFPFEEDLDFSYFEPAKFAVQRCWDEESDEEQSDDIIVMNQDDNRGVRVQPPSHEPVEQESRPQVFITPEMEEARARLKHTREELEAIRKKRAAKRSTKAETVTETDKEAKRRANATMYYQIYLAQKAKLTELGEKLEWMENKQARKLTRIQAMKRENLNFEQKIELRGLKKSSKKLESKITRTNSEITQRQATISKISELQKKSLTNPNPMKENPTLLNIELANVNVIKVASDRDVHIRDHTAPPSTPADDLVRPFIESPIDVALEERTYTQERPRTRTIARFNPKSLIKRLSKRIVKKTKSSRPLGAHHHRVRSVTENMQEVIPYEDQHYDSDEDMSPAQPSVEMESEDESSTPEPRVAKMEDVFKILEMDSELRDMGESSAYESLHNSQWTGDQMRNVDDEELLALYEDPTNTQSRCEKQASIESDFDVDVEVDKILKTDSAKELLAMFENPSTSQPAAKQEREELEPSFDLDYEVDQLLNDPDLLAEVEASELAKQTGQQREEQFVSPSSSTPSWCERPSQALSY